MCGPAGAQPEPNHRSGQSPITDRAGSTSMAGTHVTGTTSIGYRPVAAEHSPVRPRGGNA